MSDLQGKVREFGVELAELLNGTLPEVPPIDVAQQGDAFHVQPGASEGAVPLFVNGERMASLIIKIRCRLDSRDQYLAVQSSRF